MSVRSTGVQFRRPAGEPLRPGEILLELGDQTEGSAPIHRAELFVPPLETEAFLAEVRSLAAEERFALHGIAVRRLHAEVFLPNVAGAGY